MGNRRSSLGTGGREPERARLDGPARHPLPERGERDADRATVHATDPGSTSTEVGRGPAAPGRGAEPGARGGGRVPGAHAGPGWGARLGAGRGPERRGAGAADL